MHVAVGVVLGDDDRILIARRPQHLHQGGLWEFPGGKVEAGESLPVALARELAEELAIAADRECMRPLLEVRHDYGDKRVLLDVWWVPAFEGVARGCEGQALRWVSARQLADYDFPAANGPIVAAVQRAMGERSEVGRRKSEVGR